MIVYRYLPEEFGLRALQQQKWKIARLLELNDPFDCQPILSRNSGADEVLASDDAYFRELYDSIGILCYCSSINDPVIWSHYADSHRGIALGFEFKPTDGLLKVKYPKYDSRAHLDGDDLDRLKKENYDEALLKVVSDAFTKKAKSWEYEREYRHFIYLKGCDMIGSHYFRDMPLPNLRRIVLGVRSHVTESDVRRIMSRWQIPCNVEIAKAQTDPKSYRITAFQTIYPNSAVSILQRDHTMCTNPRPPLRPFSDQYLADYSGEHVAYEITMFFYTLDAFASTGILPPHQNILQRDFLSNLAAESYATHLRNLIDFCYPRKLKLTDIIAADYCQGKSWSNSAPVISQILMDARTRADKEVAHLTSSRISGKPQHKHWRNPQHRAEIRDLLQLFEKTAAPQRMNAKIVDIIRSL